MRIAILHWSFFHKQQSFKRMIYYMLKKKKKKVEEQRAIEMHLIHKRQEGEIRYCPSHSINPSLSNESWLRG